MSKKRGSATRDDSKADEFAELGRQQQTSLLYEFVLFIKESKKWWLVPILLVCGLLGLLALLGTTGAAPFIYTIF